MVFLKYSSFSFAGVIGQTQGSKVEFRIFFSKNPFGFFPNFLIILVKTNPSLIKTNPSFGLPLQDFTTKNIVVKLRNTKYKFYRGILKIMDYSKDFLMRQEDFYAGFHTITKKERP